MNRLTYKKVFNKYATSFSHKLSQKAYSTYKYIRLILSKWYPLKEHEKYLFEDAYIPGNKHASKMPRGFDCSTAQEVDGRIDLKYVDFYDYLPKEDTDTFKKVLRRFALTNRVSRFASFRTREDDRSVDNIGRYIDGHAFSHLYDVSFSHNDYLEKYAPQIRVSIHNLSASFMVVKYRLIISDIFNAELQEIYNGEYHPFSDVSIQYDTPWYKPWKFGRSIYQSDDERYKAIYLKMSVLKWEIFKELKKRIKNYFSVDGMFPPVFTTYHTNIRFPSDREDLSFWNSLGLDYCSDYSSMYNLRVGWDSNISDNEGIHLMAFCGGDCNKNDHLPGIAEYNCSDIYCEYMVANTIRRIAERNIARYNKKISKAIRKSGSAKLLRVRAEVEKKLYYGYRFISEFSGESIEIDDSSSFHNTMIKDSSLTQKYLTGITERTQETKKQIDTMLHLLDDSAEYQTAKSNMILQWGMLLVTILSLAVAIITLTGMPINILSAITSFIKTFF